MVWQPLDPRLRSDDDRRQPTSRRQHFARPREVGRSIDTERNGVNEHHVDAHAGFERTQLLEPLRLIYTERGKKSA